MIQSVSAAKAFRAAIAFAAIAWAASGSAWAAVASVQNIQGDVFLLKAGSAAEAWTKIQAPADVDNGDTLRTDEGTCTLQYGEIAGFAVEAHSRMVVQSGETEDLSLLSGKIKAKVDKSKVVKPFRVVTPTAVAAIRGTDVDFDFDENGQLTIDLHNGNIQVVNEEADMNVDLGGKKSITLFYDPKAGILRVRNECSSDDKVVFSILGVEYAENPCEEKEIELGTEAGPGGTPDAGTPDDTEAPESLPPDESPIQS